MEKGTGTRSSLLWEVERLLKECNELPQILLMENVPMVHSSENIKDFEKWLLFLESLGYKNYWKDLNAKNYGIPQNRDRCYMISLLNSNCDYTFPKPIKLKLRLKDMLEEKVDKKYFFNKALNLRFTENYIQYDNSGKGHNSQASRLYYQDGLSPTLPNRNNGDKTQIILVDKKVVKSLFTKDDNAKNYNDIIVAINTLWTETQAKMITPDGNVKRYINSDIVDEFKEGQAADISFPNGYNKAKRVHNECPAINGTTTESSFIVKNDLRIRKLTPKECYRLMGFSDDDFDKAEKINSNSQLYKQAGNSIVVNVLMAIFKQFFN